MSHAYGCRTRGGTRGDSSSGEQFGGGKGGRALIASYGAASPRPAAAQVRRLPAAPPSRAALDGAPGREPGPRPGRGAQRRPPLRRGGVRGFPLPEPRPEVF